IPNPAKEPKPDGVLVSPGSDGATNWLAPSFDPNSRLLFVSARRLWSIFYMTAEGKPEGWAGRDRNLWANSVLEAIDYRTGDVSCSWICRSLLARSGWPRRSYTRAR